MVENELKTKEDLVKQFREGSLTDAARKIIAAEGFGGVTVERVAELAGVSKGTIYLYFKNKEDLIRAAIVSTFRTVIAQVREATEREAAFDGQLRALVATQLRLFAENQAFFRALASDHSHAPKPGCQNDEIIGTHLAYVGFVSEIITRGQRDGRVRRDLASEEAAFFLVHLLQSTGFRHLFGFAQGDLGSEAEVNRIVPLVLNGIGSHGD